MQAVIMAVPERQALVTRLLARLGDIPVVWDAEHKGHVFNWWQAVDAGMVGGTWPAPRPSHVLILEDDAVPCRDLLATVEHLTTLLPDEPINLFGRMHTELGEAKARGAALVKYCNAFSYDIGCVYPVQWLRELRRRYDARWAEMNSLRPWAPDKMGHWGADTMRFFLFRGTAIWATVPSLVDHAGVPSTLVGHNPASCPADWFIGEHGSGLAVDWTRGLAV